MSHRVSVGNPPFLQESNSHSEPRDSLSRAPFSGRFERPVAAKRLGTENDRKGRRYPDTFLMSACATRLSSGAAERSFSP